MLKDFSKKIAKLYEKGKILTPVHISSGNERQLKTIFRHIKKEDWIFATYRSHYHWILSGRSAKKLEKMILAGRSMNLFDKKFFTSAIVAGHVPIAVGAAQALKWRGSQNHVYCFLGDSAAECGIFHESVRFAKGHDLPITFIVEDNGLSVNSDTQAMWGYGKEANVIRYKYERVYPHAGIGKHVLF